MVQINHNSHMIGARLTHSNTLYRLKCAGNGFVRNREICLLEIQHQSGRICQPEDLVFEWLRPGAVDANSRILPVSVDINSRDIQARRARSREVARRLCACKRGHGHSDYEKEAARP